jgi:hypothetical protein
MAEVGDGLGSFILGGGIGQAHVFFYYVDVFLS